MRLTVLGKSPSWQDAGGACSGYLVEERDTAVVVDCGNGVFSKLRRFRDYTAVDAVISSHLHADHFLDLVPFAYALTYAPRQQPVAVDRWPGTDAPARPRLLAPEGATELFRRVVGAWGNEDLIEKAFEIEEFHADSVLAIGSLRFRFQTVPHFTETFAIDIASTNGGGRVTYGADCSPNDTLVAFANFDRMRRQIDELFGDAWTRAGLAPQRRPGFRPRVDVYYCGTERPKAVVKADLAGISAEDLNIEIRGRTLVISGERKA